MSPNPWNNMKKQHGKLKEQRPNGENVWVCWPRNHDLILEIFSKDDKRNLISLRELMLFLHTLGLSGISKFFSTFFFCPHRFGNILLKYRIKYDECSLDLSLLSDTLLLSSFHSFLLSPPQLFLSSPFIHMFFISAITGMFKLSGLTSYLGKKQFYLSLFFVLMF